MLLVTIIAALCGIFYALKGGSGKHVFTNWAEVRHRNRIFERLLDGKVISTLCLFTALMVVTFDVYLSLAMSIAWLAAVAPSMGEEHQAIGHSTHWGGAYKMHEADFGRMYGVKKGLQRGVWMGACFAIVTGYVPYLCFSLLFVPMVYIGQDLRARHTGNRHAVDWCYAEFLIGAICIGVPTGLYLGGL